jgi:hypothetical protein
MRGLPNHQKEKFITPCNNIFPDPGYIVFKDAKVVIFYTNDLNGTPSNPIWRVQMKQQSNIAEGFASYIGEQEWRC